MRLDEEPLFFLNKLPIAPTPAIDGALAAAAAAAASFAFSIPASRSAIRSSEYVYPRNSSIGTGNTIVEFFSLAIEFNVCKYRSWRAAGLQAITSAASFKARDALCSPSAAITFARASLVAVQDHIQFINEGGMEVELVTS